MCHISVCLAEVLFLGQSSVCLVAVVSESCVGLLSVASPGRMSDVAWVMVSSVTRESLVSEHL